MSGGSILQTVGTVLGGVIAGPLGALAGGKAGGVANDMVHPPKPPDLKAPNALSKTPTQADASAKAAQDNLDQERAAAGSLTTYTGGQGVMDQPSLTSRTLLGS